ncbi:TonB-dependent receptor [Novosphingobium album (ex Hu et al. 2023)]|uniref:TonB-dependent receptor n=1 Tax=Novosphingobium album (ex Hu et al. 2023) TaxID=2930093 RepID=A0ABT0B799_9SPHN|nr:TonB-dependent receptor [Novosphingobium album (ex Hu et al. 2023)]MCJ2180950.1 TonB-dependent receptor [Novosphingobium album (ex Hu et al. 2023)]
MRDTISMLSIRTRLSLGTSALLAIPFFVSPVQAQEAADAGGTQPSNEIIVTAQQRNERLQDVPIQIQALTGETLQNAGIRTSAEALSMTPNATFDQGNTYKSTFITMRGLTQINNADPPVAFVIDGVPQTDQTQLNVNLYDVERIEILKGPQGALYGRNAEGGAVNIVTRMPADRIEGFADVQYGNGRNFVGSAGVSGPLAGKDLLFRVDGSYSHFGGLIDNSYRGDKSDFIDHDWSLRGRLLARPASNLTVDLRAEYGEYRAASNYYSAVFSGDPNDFVDPQFNLPGFAYGHSLNLTAKVDLDLDFATVTSITGHTELTQNNRADLDFRNPVDSPSGIFGLGFQAGQGQDLDLKTTSQELRIVSNGDQALRWLAGGYYLHTSRDLRTRGFVDLDGDPAQIDNTALLFANKQEANSNNAYAAFAQVDYDILSSLTLTGGLRYDEDHRNQLDVVAAVRRRSSYNHLQPKVTLTYKPMTDVLVYATYSTGFRSGGYNAPSVAIGEFKAESLQNYEAGFKAQFANGLLTVNGAYYFENVKNYQYFYVDAASASQIIDTIDRVHIQGLELEVIARPLPGLDLSGAIGTTLSKIKEDAVAEDIGNRTPRTVPFSANMSAQYTWALTGDATALVRADWQHIGKKYWSADNAQVQNAYNLVNMRAGVEIGGLGLYGFVKNLTNDKYYTEFVPTKYSGLDVDLGYRGRPRTYGIEARVTF